MSKRVLGRILVSIVAVGSSCAGFAKESKWIGPASGGDFSDAANNWDSKLTGR